MLTDFMGQSHYLKNLKQLSRIQMSFLCTVGKKVSLIRGEI